MILTDFVVCEDIRHEHGNKLSLMGVFQDQFVISAASPGPIVTRLAVFFRVLRESDDPQPDSFEVEAAIDGEGIGVFRGTLGTREAGAPIAAALQANPFFIPRPGQLTFECRFRSGNQEFARLAPAFSMNVLVVQAPESK